MDADRQTSILRTDILTLLDLLYEAVLRPETCPAFLAASSTFLNAQGTQIAHQDLENRKLSFSFVHGYNWPPEPYRRYESLMSEDPRRPHFAANPFMAVRCRTYLTDEELHASRVYQEVLSVGEVEYSMGVNLSEDRRTLSYFLALRNDTQPRFTEQDCAAVEQMIPLLTRALRLQRDMQLIDFERRIAMDSLDGVAAGVFALGTDGAVRFSNQTAQDMLSEGDGLALRYGTLAAPNEMRSFFVDAIRQLTPNNDAVRKELPHALQTSRSSGQTPYLVTLALASESAERGIWSGDAEPLIMVVVRDPHRPTETRAEILQRIFNLAPAQARLADVLAGGRTLAEAAALLRITEASARQYCKACLENMEVNRQSELVRKVLSVPQPLSQTPWEQRTFVDDGGSKSIDGRG